jgi:hypothetical protein
MVTEEERRARDAERSRDYYRRNRAAILAKRAERARIANEAAKAQGVVGYKSAHDRVQRRRGPASDFMCSACQRADATCWGLIRHSAGFVDVPGQEGYSVFVSDYEPLCTSCNRRNVTGEWVRWRDAA